MKSWLFNRDPHNGLLESSHNCLVFHPLYTLKQQFFFPCSDRATLKDNLAEGYCKPIAWELRTEGVIYLVTESTYPL